MSRAGSLLAGRQAGIMESRWIWPFELLEKIGEGGMGVVYRARYVGNDRIVAVKLLPPEVAANETLLARFERELEVLKQLRHPNIVHCFGGTCESNERFYAMELVDGGTLADVIQQRGRLSWEVAVDYAIQMCDALQYAHERGVIHRDVKPGNFLMTKLGQLKLSDFGLVTVVSGRRITAAGRTLGTVQYMSPEQIRGKPAVSNRSDLYSLGCVLFEMLTGQPPFLGETPVETMHKHLKEPVPHVARTLLDCPLELDQLVYDLLAKAPELRPASAEEVKRRLEGVLHPGRLTGPVEPSLFLLKSPATSTATPLEGIKHSESLAELSAIAPVESWLAGRTGWMAAIVLLIACVVGWSGWSSSAARMRQAERALVDQLDGPQPQARVFAIQTLARFGPLHPETAARLLTATRDSQDEVKVAALDALAAHAAEFRAHQVEIYKLQHDHEVSSHIRHHAGQTLEALKQARSGSLGGTLVWWTFALALPASLAAGAWLLWNRLRPYAQ